MEHPLAEVSRTRSSENCYLVIEDYRKYPRLCRFGIWVGWKCDFVETVLLGYEHDPEDLYVGWSINGTTVIDPGYSSGTPPWGAPAPGASSVTYRCPVGGLFHRLSLTSATGIAEQCLWVQVLYRYPNEAGAPFHSGPSMYVCLSGSEIIWPISKVEEAEACMEKFYDLLRRYVEPAHIGPGGPVERWLERVSGDEAVRVRALLETIEQLDQRVDGQLFDAINAELKAIVLWAQSPGGSGIPAPPKLDVVERSEERA
jgi:hypothetical protein